MLPDMKLGKGCRLVHEWAIVVCGECDNDKDKEDGKDSDKDKDKENICHERAKTGDCGQRRSSVSTESGPGLEFSAEAGSGSRILDLAVYVNR